jgi:site-specific recombinase XerD
VLLAYRTFVRLHYTSNPNEKHFFVQREGKPLNVGTMQKIMARIGRAAKAPRLHPHLLRHTSATNYLVHGGDVNTLQRKLRHSSLTVTDRYDHLASEQAAAQERVAPMDKLHIRPMSVPKAR